MFKNSSSVRASVAISLGAIAGSLCRYYLGLWITQSADIIFPMGTFMVNLSGCLLMGFITTITTSRLAVSPDLVLLMTTGFLGAYTTFSSYELDTANLLELKNLQRDLVYWIGSPLLGLLCFRCGVLLANFAQPKKN
ncbi:crcB protein [Xenococcus sp. PCC 7305]|uniref:fluoride efflux transporter CrcB n=1 Tax=Xenococcus sp. PCC 7305 TaxID=102125 RepID=UPI0002ACEC1C|nr:fluoride efflux transporter CrcB [Xenococcus sp. PCC 7305]ELS05242.1 crcB protein [Xenococcus sp. PCC 7305]